MSKDQNDSDETKSQSGTEDNVPKPPSEEAETLNSMEFALNSRMAEDHYNVMEKDEENEG